MNRNNESLTTIIEHHLETGRVYIGINEVYKNLQRGLVNVVLCAQDISPEALLNPVINYCNNNSIVTVRVSTRRSLGSLVNLNNRVGTACAGFFANTEDLQIINNLNE